MKKEFNYYQKEFDNLDLKNEMRTSGRVIKKKIRKIKSQVGDDDFAVVAKMKQFKKGI